MAALKPTRERGPSHGRRSGHSFSPNLGWIWRSREDENPPTVDHVAVCEALSLGPGRDRVTALRAKFAVARPQSESTLPGGTLPREWLMGCPTLEAYDVKDVSGGSHYGQTQICDRQAGLGSAQITPE